MKRNRKMKRIGDHIYSKEPTFKVVCDYCKKEFKKLPSLITHIQKVHENTNKIKIRKGYTCKYCHYVFYKKAHHDTHVKKQHEISDELKEIYVKCTFCCTYYKSEKWLSRHVKDSHIKTKDAVENKVQNEYSDLLRNLKALNSQSQPDILAQAIGDTKLDFVPNIDLRKLNVVEKNNVDLLNCDICSYKTSRISFLKRHMISHSDAKPYECTTCHRKFGYISNLKAHMKNFSNNRCLQTYKHSKRKKANCNNKWPNELTENNKDSNILNLSNMDMSVDVDDSLLNNIINNMPDTPPPNLSDIDLILNDKKEKSDNGNQEVTESFNHLVKINVDPRTFVSQDGVTCDVVATDNEANLNPKTDLDVKITNNKNEKNNKVKIDIISDITIKNNQVFTKTDLNLNVVGAKDISSEVLDNEHNICFPLNEKVLCSNRNIEEDEANSFGIIKNGAVSNNANEMETEPEIQYNIDELLVNPSNNLNVENNDNYFNTFEEFHSTPKHDSVDSFDTSMFSPLYSYDSNPNTQVMANVNESDTVDDLLLFSPNNIKSTTVNLNDLPTTSVAMHASDLPPDISQVKYDKYENDMTNCVNINNVIDINYLEGKQENNFIHDLIIESTVENCETNEASNSTEEELKEKINKENKETEKLFLELLSETTIKTFNKVKQSNNHVCGVCKKRFQSKSNLDEHIDIVHNNSQYVCDKCGKIFKSRKSISNHLKLHLKPWSVKCQICEKSVARPSLRQHMRIHNNDTPFICLLCGKRFKSHSSKQCHIINHHLKVDDNKPKEPNLIDLINEIDGTEQPEIPPLLLTSINQVKKQYKIIEKKTKSVINCTICDKTFKSPYLLKRHLKSHQKIECGCGKTFDGYNAYRSHKIRYHNPKKYPTDKN